MLKLLVPLALASGTFSLGSCQWDVLLVFFKTFDLYNIKEVLKMIKLKNYKKMNLNKSWAFCKDIDDFMKYVKSYTDTFDDALSATFTSVEDSTTYDLAHISNYFKANKSYKLVFTGKTEDGKCFYAITSKEKEAC